MAATSFLAFRTLERILFQHVRHVTLNRFTALLTGKFLSLAGPGVLGPLFALLPFAIRDHLPDRYLSALTP
jgi:hypothetical protein